MNEKPQPSQTADLFDHALKMYGDTYDQATSQVWWRGQETALRRLDDEQAENFAQMLEDIENRITALKSAQSWLENAEALRQAGGATELKEYETKLYKWHEENRNRQMFDENPEAYTLHAVAVKKVMREAQAQAKVKWNRLENYWLPLAVYATVNGLTSEEADKAVSDYIEARQMSYTVSTKNLKMKVA